jgi:hypothetical protein
LRTDPDGTIVIDCADMELTPADVAEFKSSARLVNAGSFAVRVTLGPSFASVTELVDESSDREAVCIEVRAGREVMAELLRRAVLATPNGAEVADVRLVIDETIPSGALWATFGDGSSRLMSVKLP